MQWAAVLHWADSNLPKRDAANFFERAAALGCATALNNLAICYDQGFGRIKKNRKQAFQLWQRAAQMHHARSITNLGVAYENGHGVKRDFRVAVEQYTRAGS